MPTPALCTSHFPTLTNIRKKVNSTGNIFKKTRKRRDFNELAQEKGVFIGKNIPDVGDILPDAGDFLSDFGDNLPDFRDFLPDVRDILPDVGDILPDVGDNIPDAGDKSALISTRVV